MQPQKPGYICQRKHLLASRCCDVRVPSTRQYSCDDCLPSGCCGTYEHRVSCCLQPGKVARPPGSPLPAAPLGALSPPARLPAQPWEPCDSSLGAHRHCPDLGFPQQLLLERFLNLAAVAFQNLFMAVEDHFELCLAKCRTSSQSVQHENTYRDPVAKYCYGESPPELLLV